MTELEKFNAFWEEQLIYQSGEDIARLGWQAAWNRYRDELAEKDRLIERQAAEIEVLRGFVKSLNNLCSAHSPSLA